MAKPKYIGYDATGAKTSQNQLIEISKKYNEHISGNHIETDEETGYLVDYTSLDSRIDADHYPSMWAKPSASNTIFVSDSYLKYAKPYALKTIVDNL